MNLSIGTTEFDILHGPQCDLADDAVWRPLRALIEGGKFPGLIAGPPCETFSRVRNLPGGPPPLRGVEGSLRYGLRGLTPKQTEQVRLHNLLAVRTAEAATIMQQLGLPSITEQLAVRNNEVSMFKLDEHVKLMELPQANHTISPQCAYGAAAAKLTSYVYFIVDLSDMPTRCLHPLRAPPARPPPS